MVSLKDSKFTTPRMCQLGDVIQAEAILKTDILLQTNAKKLLKLFATTASALITKTVTQNKTQSQQSKIVTSENRWCY